jgi:flagellar protein FlbT
MAGLMLKFPAGERLFLNGAVIENVGRGARLRVLTPDTQLLRLRDAVDPRDVATPVGRLCHAVQLLLIGEEGEDVRRETLAALVPLRHAFVDARERACIDAIAQDLRERRDYQALRGLGRLRACEATLLAARPS